MTHTIHCEIDRAEGSLQRLIGLIERRGFDISSLDMGAIGGAVGGAVGGGHAAGEGIGANSRRRIAVGVSPRDDGRCVAVLGRQIDRLYGVRRVEAPFAHDVFGFSGEPA